MMTRLALLPLLAVTVQAGAQAAPRKLAADTALSTPGGTNFTAPAGWSVVREEGGMIVLEMPEPDSHVVVSDSREKDPVAAVEGAWTAYKQKRQAKLVNVAPARNGWDERRIFDYETSPNERAYRFAAALRKGNVWTVLLLDAIHATLEKREAGLVLVSETLGPKGYRPESFRDKTPHLLDAKRIQLLKDFVAEGMKQLDIPGVGLALIDRGKVVFEGGLGVRELGKKDPVDANTLFIAASNTKALTTLLLARLVDEGKLSWDMPVVRVYPGFKLGNAATTEKVLLKHLVCACTGLPRQDLEWLFEFKDATPLSEVKLLGTIQPTTNFGETYQYSNLLAAMGGFVAAHASSPDGELGAAYDEAMRKMIFQPLGMNSTTFDFAAAQKGNWARPHGYDLDGKPALASMDLNYSVVPLRPAGGAWTSAHDLARYLQMELARGVAPDGKRLVSEKNLLARREKQVKIGEHAIYGMGLETDTTWDVPVVHHGGSIIGYRSDMMFLPEHGAGAVLLTNGASGWMLERPLMRRLLEVLFDGKPEAEEDLRTRVAAEKARLKQERERLVVPADGTRLAHHYRNPALGEITVEKKGTSTIFNFGEWGSIVASRKNDDGTISFIAVDPAALRVEFVAGERTRSARSPSATRSMNTCSSRIRRRGGAARGDRAARSSRAPCGRQRSAPSRRSTPASCAATCRDRRRRPAAPGARADRAARQRRQRRQRLRSRIRSRRRCASRSRRARSLPPTSRRGSRR
jgi:CubicO group peptidase (beta-lactamase class C family)